MPDLTHHGSRIPDGPALSVKSSSIREFITVSPFPTLVLRQAGGGTSLGAVNRALSAAPGVGLAASPVRHRRELPRPKVPLILGGGARPRPLDAVARPMSLKVAEANDALFHVAHKDPRAARYSRR